MATGDRIQRRTFGAGRQVESIGLAGGLDDGLGQTVSARHASGAEHIRWNARLADILTAAPGGRRIIDSRRFHDGEPLS